MTLPFVRIVPLFFLAVVLLLTACQDDFDKSKTDSRKADEKPLALTWQEYVKRITAKGREEHYGGIYLLEGLPEMSLWLPEDFLTQE